MKSLKAGLLIAMIILVAGNVFSQSMSNLTRPQEGRSMRATSGNPYDNNDSAAFAMGETKTIAELDGPGKITHVWLVPSSLDIRYPRALVLRIFWDGATVPSVEVPLGDFFAAGNGMRAVVDSLPVKVSSYGRGYNCYWEMPFAKKRKSLSATSPTRPMPNAIIRLIGSSTTGLPEP